MKQDKLTRFALAAGLAVAGVAIGGSGEVADVDVKVDQTVLLKDSKAAPGTIRLSRFMNSDIHDTNGKDIGDIRDVILDRGYDKISYVIIQHGGVAGVGEKLAAVPYRGLKLGGPADTKVYVRLTEDAIEKAPEFDDSKWPAEANVEYYRSLDSYYATHLGEVTVDKDADAQLSAATLAEPTELPWTRRVTKLIGRDVLASSNNERLGHIEDIVVDAKTGVVSYAVLAHRMLGAADSYYAVPLNSFKTKPEDKKLVLEMSVDDLKNTPTFDKDHWPMKADARWDVK